ncbi:MAG: CNNM domain-containing protein [candidate division WOR-3 bacterium]
MFDILLFLFFSLSSFLISGIETSFFSLSTFELKKFSKKISFLEKLSEEKNTLLFFLISLNTFFNVGIVILFNKVISKVDTRIDYKVFEILFLLFYILFFCEILPKTLSIYQKIMFLKSFLFFFPFFKVFQYILKIFFKEKKIKMKKIETDFESIYYFLEEHKENIENEYIFLKGYYELKDRNIYELAPQKEKIVKIEKGSVVKDALSLYKEKKFSRIPVFEKENPVGVLYIKDLLFKDEREVIDGYIKNFERVEYDQKLHEVLNLIIKKRIHIVFIFKKDSFYSIITLDDIVYKILKGLKITNV